MLSIFSILKCLKINLTFNNIVGKQITSMYIYGMSILIAF